MNHIPESARRHMQRQTPGDHPDADLLTAFAERTLTGNEREGVLSHLAACATCREVVSLAMPDQVEAEVVAPASSWFRWPMLRWTAVAATVVVVWAAVSVLVPRRESTEPTVEVPASAPQAKYADPQAKPQTPEEAVALQGKKPAARDESRERAQKQVAPLEKKPSAPSPKNEIQSADTITALPVLKAVEPATENAKKLDDLKDQNARADAGISQGALGGVVGGAVRGNVAVMAKTAPGAVGPSAQADAAKAKSAPAAEENEAFGARQKASTINTNAANRNAAVGGPSNTANVAMSPAAANAGAAPPPPPSQAAQETAANAAVAKDKDRAAGRGYVSRLPSGLAVHRAELVPASRWRVSSAGAVERSTNGKTWDKVEIDPSVTFRAMSSNDGDLWAGGTGGALFHSADAGRTWSRVKVGDEGMWVSETITSVDFLAPQAGTITTESRATWSTRDGGRTWQRLQ